MVVTIIYTLQKAVCFLPKTALPWHIYSRLYDADYYATPLKLNGLIEKLESMKM